MNRNRLVLCLSDLGDGGWSLHAPDSTDADIAEGIAPALASGTGEPTRADYADALLVLRARSVSPVVSPTHQRVTA
jgi:hypothetical protein